ncbi:MAG: response regulator transcription factor [Vicingus serpentipes]|nr:response regulator transcription factor [Vicingus serpentipes]
MDEVKIMIVDDNDTNRSLLKLLFKTSRTINVIAEATDGNEAIEILLLNPDIDLIIMDIDMPDMNGIDATRKIKTIAPKIKILCNSFHSEAHYIQEMIKAGALGYINKNCTLDSYTQAINTIINHGVYLSEDIYDETYSEVFKHLKNKILSEKTQIN